jgi:Fe-S-cluster-containing hydrogenase component 2
MRSVLMMNSDRGYSGGTAFNLNVDLADKANNTVIPMDLVKRVIDKADYVAAMDKCLCRTANNCQRVPHDIACMFLGKGGRTVADHRIGHEITKEQAYAKIERAAAEGLVCMSLWVQVEQLVWGIRNQEMSDMVEICFCCPCCCTALNLCKETTPDIRRRFTPSGFTATVDHDLCIACHKCVGDGDKAYCPMDAIQFRGSDNKMVVNQEMCIGCRYCKERCPVGAIRIQQTMPMRESMHDYFIEETRLDLVVDGYPGPGAK